MLPNRLIQINYHKINRRYYTISLPQDSKLNIDYIWLDVNFTNIYENITNGDGLQDISMADFIKENEENIIIEVFSYINNILNSFDLSKAKCIMITYDNMIYNRVIENSKSEDGINIYVSTHDFVVINNHVFLMTAIESLNSKLNWTILVLRTCYLTISHKLVVTLVLIDEVQFSYIHQNTISLLSVQEMQS